MKFFLAIALMIGSFSVMAQTAPSSQSAPAGASAPAGGAATSATPASPGTSDSMNTDYNTGAAQNQQRMQDSNMRDATRTRNDRHINSAPTTPATTTSPSMTP